MLGTVKWYNYKKRYGFILAEDGREIFVHYTGIVKNNGKVKLEADTKVSFELKDTEKGPVAINVRPA